jgi:hypothetical protein
MNWFVNRGEDLIDTVPRTFQFYRNVTIRRAKFKWDEKLVSSMDESAKGPMYFATDSR